MNIGQQLCADGLLGATDLSPQGTFMCVCGHSFAREPQDFPRDNAFRLEDFSILPYPQNYIDHWFHSRVGTFLHEMHHAVVPTSKSNYICALSYLIIKQC